MPTMIIFAMIVGIFTIIQFVIDVYRGRTSEYLLVINTIIFAIAIIGLLAYGFKSSGVSLIFYSIGHLYAYLALIGGTVFLYGVAHFVKEKSLVLLSSDSDRDSELLFHSCYISLRLQYMTCFSIHSSLFSGNRQLPTRYKKPVAGQRLLRG